MRIGLAVAHNAVRAVAIRDKRIVWASEVPVAASDELEPAIESLLAQAPLPRWPRPAIHAAIGPHGAQLKRIQGLPDISDVVALTAIVREATGTFFLKNGVALVTTGIRPAGGGAVLAAALDRPCVDAIRSAARARGLRAGPIAPTAVALTRAFVDPSFRWSDGTLTLEVTRAGETLESVRTRPAKPEDVEAAAAPTLPELSALGSDSVRYADAFGAAALDVEEPLALAPETPRLLAFTAPRRSLARFALIFALGVVAIGLSPLGATWAGKRAQANVAQLRPGRWQVISSALNQLALVTTVLREAETFAASRTSISQLLAELTRLLPEGSVLLTFDWSEGRGEAVVLTTDAAGTLAAVRRLPGVAAAELVGSVTSQSAGGREFQRVTIRFK